MYKKEYKLCYNNEGVHLESAILVQIKIDAIENWYTDDKRLYRFFLFSKFRNGIYDGEERGQT